MSNDTTAFNIAANMHGCSFADGFGEELIIDVGRCRRHCRHTDGLSKDEFLNLLDSHRDTDPVQVGLNVQVLIVAALNW